MKKLKKLLVGALALMMAVSTAACGGGGNGGGTSSSGSAGGNSSSSLPSGGDGNVSENPFVLDVYSFTGGYGEDWLTAVTERYKKEKAGKKFTVDGVEYDGVTFKKTLDKELIGGKIDTGETHHVWFEEQVFYNQFMSLQKPVFHDMTDVLTSDNPYEPGKTLLSKFTDTQKEYYERDGKYYGIPHYAGYVGIVYNKALFDLFGCYFAEDYDESLLKEYPDQCLIAGPDDPRAPGPDGISGTSDDGLPTTYDEFYAICNIIAASNKPLAWSGKHRQGYLGWFMGALANNNLGKEQAQLNYTFDGTIKDLITVEEDAEGNVVEIPMDDVVLNADNVEDIGYMLSYQRGKYYAFDFMETIVDNGWYTANSFEDTNEQTAAQKDFVVGTLNFTEQASMLIEGCWWEMESKDSFLALEQGGTENPKDDFAWMPLPCITKEEAEARAAAFSDDDPTTKGYTLTDTHNSLCFIGAQVSEDVYKVAKDFIQFAYTDESLAEFSIITDTTKALNYEMTPAQKAQMSAYGRSLMEMQENAEIVYTFSKADFYRNNETALMDYKTAYIATIGGKDKMIPADEFKGGTNASQYFKGYQTRQKFFWDYEITRS